MKLTLAFLILLFASNSSIAQSGKGSFFKVKAVKPALNHGAVVRTVAHRTHDGRIISSVASSKANRKKYRKTHIKGIIRLPANGSKVRTLR